MRRFFNRKNLIILAIVLVFLIALSFFLPKKVKQPTVISTVPQNNASEVLETSQLAINFNDDIEEQVKSQVSVTFSPEVNFDSVWQSSTYKIIPKNSLENNQKYTVKVLFNKNEIYSFSFTTATFSQADIKKYGELQTQNDLAYGDAVKALVAKYPFYTKLPIRTKDYIVDFNFDLKQFAITFLVPIESDSQKNSLVKSALDNLRKIGVKDPITYYTQP